MTGSGTTCVPKCHHNIVALFIGSTLELSPLAGPDYHSQTSRSYNDLWTRRPCYSLIPV